MIRKILEVYEVSKGEMPDRNREVYGFSFEHNEWLKVMLVGENFYRCYHYGKGEMLEGGIDFWMELSETFEDDFEFYYGIHFKDLKIKEKIGYETNN